jgi:hypothetical protein
VIADGLLDRHGSLVRSPEHVVPGRNHAFLAAMARLEVALDVASPPPLSQAAREAGCTPDLVRALELEGRMIRVEDDLAWAESAWRRLAATALELARREPLTPAMLRDATRTSRKYAVALLEDLNRRAILRRTPTGHVPGARAPSLLQAPGNRSGDPLASDSLKQPVRPAAN